MAINAFDLGDKSTPPLIHSLKRVRAPGSVRMIKIKCDDDSSKRGKTKKKKNSPYLHGEKIQLFSRMTEKRMVHNNNEVFSSYPMAANIYRASSDEFKALKKIRHKSRKSVLTLPNVPAPIPKSCTVSDMNDSDYFNNKIDKKYGAPKRYVNPNPRKNGIKTKGFEFYDRDARHFECSSTDLLVKNGDMKTFSGGGKSGNVDDVTVQDVWSVLRNINKFQFSSPPRISDEDSFASKKKKKIFTKKYRNRKGRRLIETCRTEEVAYVANFEISSKTSASQSSSYDRVTVISKANLQNEPKLEKAIEGPQNPRRNPYKPKNLIPLNDRKPLKNSPRLDYKPKNDNAPFMNTRNTHVGRLFNHNNRTIPAIKERRSVRNLSPNTIDSSNCLRLSEYDDSNCTLTPHPTQANQFNEARYNKDSNDPNDYPNKSLKITNDTVVSSNERMTIGMTQMMLHGDNNNVHSMLHKGFQKPKPRLVTTMPSAAAMPKLTAADIKRRIAQIKFPLVILGKDQVSSSLEVVDCDAPQFDGLNKHIWPFMIEWKKKTSSHPKKYSPRTVDYFSTNLRKVNNELSLVKSSRDKRIPYCDVFSKKKADFKRGTQAEGLTQKKVRPIRQFKDKMLKLLYKNNYPVDAEPVLIKPMQVNASTDMLLTQEGDCNKLQTPVEKNVIWTEEQKPLTIKKVAFEEQVSICKKPGDNMIATIEKPRSVIDSLNRKMPGARHPWAKAKWASDFVDNVMRKIKNGTYYAIEENKALENVTDKPVKNDSIRDTKEISIQAVIDVTEKADFEQNFSEGPTILDKNDKALSPVYDPLINIPGFDDTPTNLEITTFSSNQIQVKNCMTNVMVQFDVSLPSNKHDNLFLEEKSSSSSSYIPLSVSNSKTRIFKCSTTILNTVLPAELCTVIPKLMKEIFDSTTTLASATTAPNINISELSECESDVTGSFNSNACKSVINPWASLYPPRTVQKQQISRRHKYWRYSPNSQWFNPSNTWNGTWMPPSGWPEYLPLHVSPVLTQMLKGRFGFVSRKSDSSILCKPIKMKLNWYDHNLLQKLCPQDTMAIVVDPVKSMSLVVDPIQSLSCKTGKIHDTIESPIDVVKSHTCTALELYKGGKTSSIFPSGQLTTLLRNMWNYCKFKIHFMIPVIIPRYTNSDTVSCSADCKNITLNMMVEDTPGLKNTVSVTITHVNNYYESFENSELSLGQQLSGTISENEKPQLKCLDCQNSLDVVQNEPKSLPRKIKEKFRKRTYGNLYKKCKSTSHIEGAKLSTPLNKITNIEEFTQALGAVKALCSVFDGCSTLRVLKCVEEIKLWIKDISPRQALLVLLLANKKETPNISRCRSVLLQGIALNRITRASELDMEIEVIERENVQVAQCDGINYITATVANQDSLYEELCWIAKTTASDYQKPFDETSERLLKSLLGKRKKLSPSYLRVMARYVGLGLLKSQSHT